MMLTKIDGFCALKNQIFGKPQGPNISKREKGPKKWVFSENPVTRISMVATTMGTLVPFGRRFSAIFSFFFYSFLFGIFFDIFAHVLACFSCRKLDEKLCKSEGKVSNFPRKPKTLSRGAADLLSKVEIRSNDVGMT